MDNTPNIDSNAADHVHSSGEILINKLQKGNVVMVETEDAIYELTVLSPMSFAVSVNTNDRRFEDDQEACIDTPIRWGDGLRIVIGGGVLFSKKTNGATVRGEGFSYDVF